MPATLHPTGQLWLTKPQWTASLSQDGEDQPHQQPFTGGEPEAQAQAVVQLRATGLSRACTCQGQRSTKLVELVARRPGPGPGPAQARPSVRPHQQAPAVGCGGLTAQRRTRGLQRHRGLPWSHSWKAAEPREGPKSLTPKSTPSGKLGQWVSTTGSCRRGLAKQRSKAHTRPVVTGPAELRPPPRTAGVARPAAGPRVPAQAPLNLRAATLRPDPA